MGSIIGAIFAFAIVCGILVFVHEFGHFFMAKLIGVRVETFSWGYGKRLVGFKKGDTDYRISLIPMGGYVKLSGEEDYEKKEYDPGNFMSKKRWQKFLVFFMGPLMNIVLAIILVGIVNMVGTDVPEYQGQKPVIGHIESGSPADRAGFQVDDEILCINKKKMKKWRDVELAVGTKPEKNIFIDVRRGKEIKSLKLLTESRTKYDMGYAGFYGKILTQVAMVRRNSPAEKSGIMLSDVILRINDIPVYYSQFEEVIRKNAGKELDFLIERGGETLKFKVTPELKGKGGEIGVEYYPETVVRKYKFFSAFNESVKSNLELTFLVFDFLGNLITGEVSTKQLGGPIDIASFSYTYFRMGLIALVGWIAFISLQLGVINLFPVPVLDGGQILVVIIEGLFRRDFSPKLKQIIMQIGFLIFIFFVGFVILNDVAKRLPNGWSSIFPW